MNNYDVIVVGAGPAGCAAAITCAQHGLKVAIVERLSFARHRPGETLHPGFEPLFERLGVLENILDGGFIRPSGSWVKWQHERRFVPFGNDAKGAWRGFQIPRAVLDALLLDRAIAAGAHLLQVGAAKKICLQNNRIIGIQTHAGPLFCKQLIDASGAHGWLARQLGLVARRRSPRLTALYGYKQGVVDESALGMFADELGWYWTAHIGPSLYHWTRLYFEHDQVAHVSAVPAALRPLACAGKTRGADVTWRIHDQAAGEGYFITGDAAAIVDPGASHGVLKALMSGMMAAQCVIDGYTHRGNQHAISQQYRQWIRDWFDADVQKMAEFYQAHPYPPHWLDNLET